MSLGNWIWLLCGNLAGSDTSVERVLTHIGKSRVGRGLICYIRISTDFNALSATATGMSSTVKNG